LNSTIGLNEATFSNKNLNMLKTPQTFIRLKDYDSSIIKMRKKYQILFCYKEYLQFFNMQEREQDSG
jgi:hypothetical protein